MSIKFNLHNVVNTETKAKARVHYSVGSRTDGREAVTLYAKDYDRSLESVFSDARNDSDSMTDYFETSRVVIFKGDARYPAALATATRRAA